MYLDKPSLDIDENMLHWWKENQIQFPVNAVTAKKDTLCIPATSTPSERLFSKAGHITTIRTCIDLCFLVENLS